MAASETSTAPNESALQVKHRASPMAAAITPPSAAPNTRAMFAATELRVTAFGRSPVETISGITCHWKLRRLFVKQACHCFGPFGPLFKCC